MRAERYLRSHHCQEFRSQDKDPRYLLYMCDFSITSWGFYLPPILSWVTLLLPYLEEWRIDSLLRVLFALLTDPLFFSIGGVIRCVAWRAYSCSSLLGSWSKLFVGEFYVSDVWWHHSTLYRIAVDFLSVLFSMLCRPHSGRAPLGLKIRSPIYLNPRKARQSEVCSHYVEQAKSAALKICYGTF